MKKFVKFDVFVSTDLDKPLLAVDPIFSFSFDFDDDDDDDCRVFYDKRYCVEQIVFYFRHLGCKSFYELTEKCRPGVV